MRASDLPKASRVVVVSLPHSDHVQVEASARCGNKSWRAFLYQAGKILLE